MWEFIGCQGKGIEGNSGGEGLGSGSIGELGKGLAERMSKDLVV